MSPDGEQLTQGISNELSMKENIMILCGHYKGIDERIREHLITREISAGDYVVSGGEIPAALLADSLVRLIPGALTDETSALSDSFQDGLLSLLFIPGLRSSMVGKCRMFCCVETLK